MTRFELATSGPPDRCATGLRHIPSGFSFSKAGAKVLLFFYSAKFFVQKVRF